MMDVMQTRLALLMARLHFPFSLRVPVSAVAPGTLPRFEMKAKRWIKD